MGPVDSAPPRALLAAWDLSDATVAPLAGGLINQTFLVEHRAARFVLQRLHPVFSAAVHRDIDVITRHLQGKGVTTPRLVPTREGALWQQWRDEVWRLQTFIEGVTVAALPGPATASAVGRGVGAFHAALLDLEHTFHFERPSAHDTPKHLAHLQRVLDEHRAHELYDQVAPVAEVILQHGQRLPAIGPLPKRIIHGDLKCQNLLLSPELDRLIALVDLDTFAHGTLAIEMGDALRSWCNPRGEDLADAAVDEALFEAAVAGYAAGTGGPRGFVTHEEREVLTGGMEIICLELAARFCADALEECYFGWEPGRFATRGAHNLVRARGQLSLSASVEAARARLEASVRRAFSTGAGGVRSRR